MSTILVADDDRDLLYPVCRYFTQRDKGLKTLTASSGAESIEILETEQVDVVLSDLRMPGGDGIDILAYLSSRSPPIPIILMSGYVQSDAAEALNRFGNLRCLSKPTPLDTIFRTVKEVLHNASEMGTFSGFSLAGVLQLVELEAKTCMVEVHGNAEREGYFAFVEGALQTALLDDLIGEDAALEMLSWDSHRVKVRALSDPEDRPRQMGCDVTGLLMRSVQIQDELTAPAEDEDPSNGLGFSGFAIEEEILQEAALAAAEAQRAEAEAAAALEEEPADERRTGGLALQTPEPGTVVDLLASRKIEPVSHRNIGLMLLCVTGVVVGCQWAAAATESGATLYPGAKALALVTVYYLVLAEAFKRGPWHGVASLVFPPYLLFFVPRKVASPLLRAAFFTALIALLVEVFLLPSQSVVLTLLNGAQNPIGP